MNRPKPQKAKEHRAIAVGASWKELEVFRAQICFLYKLDILSWKFQRHLKISMCETELMIFPQNWSSFSVSYLSQWHMHPPSFAAQNPKSWALHLHLLNHAIQFIIWSYGFCPCDISNLPVYLHLCCLHPGLGCHCLLLGLMNSNWAE